jgi:hypothetical protein
MNSLWYVQCLYDLIRQQSGTENLKNDVVFSLYKELFRWLQVRELNWGQSTF